MAFGRKSNPFKTHPPVPPAMTTLATGGVQPDIISLAGLVIGLGGIVLAALWTRYLYR